MTEINNGQKVLKVDVLAKDVEANYEDIKKLRERLVAVELVNAQLTERLTLFQLAQGVFTIIASTIAAIFSGGRS